MVNFKGQLPGLICDVRMGLFLLDVGSSVGSSEGRDNNNTGALDNRAQQMDSGGFTLLVSGYYGHGHLDNHQYQGSLLRWSLCQYVTMSQSHNANVTICYVYVTLPCDVLTRLYLWFIETTAF